MNSNTTVTQPAVYVGTYHKYNCGSIAGAWLTLTDYDDEASFYAACRSLHSNEADPELMFQDIEGIPDAFASECSVDWSASGRPATPEKRGRMWSGLNSPDAPILTISMMRTSGKPPARKRMR